MKNVKIVTIEQIYPPDRLYALRQFLDPAFSCTLQLESVPDNFLKTASMAAAIDALRAAERERDAAQLAVSDSKADHNKEV